MYVERYCDRRENVDLGDKKIMFLNLWSILALLFYTIFYTFFARKFHHLYYRNITNSKYVAKNLPR